MGDVKSLVSFIQEITLDDDVRTISPVPRRSLDFSELAVALLSPIKAQAPPLPLNTPDEPPTPTYDNNYFTHVLPYLRKRLSTIAEETEIGSSMQQSRRESRPLTNAHLRGSAPGALQATPARPATVQAKRDQPNVSKEMEFRDLTVAGDLSRRHHPKREEQRTSSPHSSAESGSVLGSIMDHPLLTPSSPTKNGSFSNISAPHSDRSILGALMDQITETPSQAAARIAARGTGLFDGTPVAIPDSAKYDDEYAVTPMRNPFRSRKALFGRSDETGGEGGGIPSPGTYFAARSGPLGDLEGKATPSRRPNFSISNVQSPQYQRPPTPTARHRHVHATTSATNALSPARFFTVRNAPLNEMFPGSGETRQKSPRRRLSFPPSVISIPPSPGAYFAAHNAALDEIFGASSSPSVALSSPRKDRLEFIGLSSSKEDEMEKYAPVEVKKGGLPEASSFVANDRPIPITRRHRIRPAIEVKQLPTTTTATEVSTDRGIDRKQFTRPVARQLQSLSDDPTSVRPSRRHGLTATPPRAQSIPPTYNPLSPPPTRDHRPSSRSSSKFDRHNYFYPPLASGSLASASLSPASLSPNPLVSITPSHITLLCRSRPGSGRARLTIRNDDSSRFLFFELAWPSDMLDVEPREGSVSPGTATRIVIRVIHGAGAGVERTTVAVKTGWDQGVWRRRMIGVDVVGVWEDEGREQKKRKENENKEWGDPSEWVGRVGSMSKFVKSVGQRKEDYGVGREKVGLRVGQRVTFDVEGHFAHHRGYRHAASAEDEDKEWAEEVESYMLPRASCRFCKVEWGI